MLSQISQMKKHHQIVFAIVIAFAVIAFWRGVWGVMDSYLFPDNYSLSSWISIIIGLALLIGTHYAPKELM